MSTSPYMPLYIADYLTDAAHLTTEEHGAYLLLIMTYWQRGKPLSADPARLANVARMPNERWASVQQTLSEFFSVVDGMWVHKRIEDELQKYRDKVEKAKMAGKASGLRRTEPKPNVRSADVGRTLDGRSPQAEPQSNQSESESESDSNIVVSDVARVREPKTDRDDLASTMKRITDTAKPILRDAGMSAGLMGSSSEIAKWIKAGCDLEADVLPVIQAAVAKGSVINSWKFFSPAIVAAKASREAPLPSAVAQGSDRETSISRPARNLSIRERALAAIERGSALADAHFAGQSGSG